MASTQSPSLSPQADSGSVVKPAELDEVKGPKVDVAEAVRRFSPFLFSIETETKEQVDLKNVIDIVSKDAQFANSFFVLDKVEVCQWLSGQDCPEAAEIRPQLQAIADGTITDASLIVQAVKRRVTALAVEREQVRLAELEAAAAAHAELVAHLMEDGLSREEAERAAREEERGEDPEGEEEDEEEEAVRPTSYIALRGFPTGTEHITAMHAASMPFNALLNINCKAKFGKREETVVDPKAKGKKAEPKKPDAKKAGVKGKGDVDAPAPIETFSAAIAREASELPPLEYHALKNVVLWGYEVPSAEGTAIDESTGLKVVEPSESEAEVAHKVTSKVLELEDAYFRYQAWLSNKTVATVAQLVNGVVAPAVPEEKPSSAAPPPPPVEEKSAAKKPPPKPEAKGAAAKGKTPAQAAKQKEEELAAAEAAAQEKAANELPRKIADIVATDELYKTVALEVTPAFMSTEMLVHCLFEQLTLTCSTATGAVSTEQVTAEGTAAKQKKDVADFADYVLAQLDGNEQNVFEAARLRRLKQAQKDSTTEASVIAQTDVLTSNEVVKLQRARDKSIAPEDCEANVLGVPIVTLENRLRAAAHKITLETLNRNKHRVEDKKTELKTFDDAKQAMRKLLVSAVGMPEDEVDDILSKRRDVELLTPTAFCDRLANISLSSDTSLTHSLTCSAGGKQKVAVVTVTDAVPEDRRRVLSAWQTMHGLLAFPQWLEWTELVAAEDAIRNPPPLDDDEMGSEPPAEEEDEEEEEEEPEEEAEDGEGSEDEFGNPKPKPKKEKKVKEYHAVDPEFADYEVKQASEETKWATVEHLRRRLEPDTEALLLSNGVTTKIGYEERTVMYCDDGCRIDTSVIRANTQSVSCRVVRDGVEFGYRGNVVRPEPRPKIPRLSSTPSLRRTPSLAKVTANPPVSAQSPRKPTPSQGKAKDPVVEAPDTPVEPEKPMPPPKEVHESGVRAVVAFADGTNICVSSSVTNIPASLDTSISVSVRGLSVILNLDGNVMLVHETPRDCPVTVYNPTTNQVTRIFGEETVRWVTKHGVVISHFADGTRLNLFPDGNTAVLHKGMWMITNSSGRRVIKQQDGSDVHTLVLSLITTNTDVETQSRVTTREDGVVTVNYSDGRMLVQHLDGTRMWTDAARSIVEVEVDGLPLVCGTPRGTSLTPRSGGGAMTVKMASGLALTLVPGERVNFDQAQVGFSAVLDLAQQKLFVKPQTAHEQQYVIDYLYGGLHTEDLTNVYTVTPHGRTWSRPIRTPSEEDDPTKPMLITTAKGKVVQLRPVVEVFRECLPMNSPFADKVSEYVGSDAPRPLHAAIPVVTGGFKNDPQPIATIPLRYWKSDVLGISPPPRSRQMKDKERTCLTELRKLIPSSGASVGSPTPTTLRPTVVDPHLFIVWEGGAMEVVRRADMMSYVNGVAAFCNLLHSDMYTEKDTKLGAVHKITSIAPPKPVSRPGIPKILVDMRASTSGAPMSLFQFQQELRQGSSAPGSSNFASSDFVQTATVCDTRHFLTYEDAATVARSKSPEPVVEGDGVEPTPRPNMTFHQLFSTEVGDPWYSSAARHLARAIPPVIAAQLSIQRQAAMLAAQRGGSRGTRGSNERVSRGSSRRSNHSQGSERGGAAAGAAAAESGSGKLPQKKRVAGNVSYVPGAPRDDPEFAQQMADLRAQELAKRKPWPTPVPNAHKAVEDVKATAGSRFWASVPETVVDTVVKENERFKDPSKPKHSEKVAANAAAAEASAKAAAGDELPTTQDPHDGVEMSPPSGAPDGGARPSTRESSRHVPTPPSRGSAKAVVHEDEDVLPPPPQDEKESTAFNESKGVSYADPHPNDPVQNERSMSMRSCNSFIKHVRAATQAVARIVATPSEVHFGAVMQGFRYSVDVQITNIGAFPARFRVRRSGEAWIVVDAKWGPIPAGLGTRVTVSISGEQPVGDARGSFLVESESGAVHVPVTVTTRSSDDAPTTVLRRGVRMVGPAKMKYTPVLRPHVPEVDADGEGSGSEEEI